ncbi:MAG TPA: phage tail length tape measure family protein [Thiohalobacter sp.]|nr:phage tail length tape measure family protein [Thiohalobacter sp.]
MATRNIALALRIQAEATQARREVRAIRKELRAAGKSGRRAGRDMQPFGNSLDRIQQSAFGLRRVLAGLGAVALFRTAIKNTVRQEQALAQVESRLQSTGGTAGFTAEQLANIASELQGVTTFGDEAILELQSQLLAFTNITGERFKRTTALVLDFATATGRDASTAARTLAVAINDPVNGMSRLRQAGIALSDEQQALIRAMAESGDMIGAQTALIEAMEKAYGGAARAARDTLGGAMQALSNAFGDLLEGSGSMPNVQDALELVTSSITGLKSSANDLADDSSIIDWGETTADTVAVVVDAVRSASIGIGSTLRLLGIGLASFAARIQAELKGNQEGSDAIQRAAREDAQAILMQIQDFNTQSAQEELERIRQQRRARADEKAERDRREKEEKAHNKNMNAIREAETANVKSQLEEQLRAYDQANSHLSELLKEREKLEAFFAQARKDVLAAGQEEDAPDLLDLASTISGAQRALAAGDFERTIELSRQATEELKKLKEAGEFDQGALGDAQALGFLEQIKRLSLEASDARQDAARNEIQSIESNIERLAGRVQQLENIQVGFDVSSAEHDIEALKTLFQGLLDEQPLSIPVVLERADIGKDVGPRADKILEDLPARAEGGPVDGPGTETSDSILARLSRNEYVISADAVHHYGERFMAAVNKRRLPKFADGGLVGALPNITRPAPAIDAGTLDSLSAPADSRAPVHLHLEGREFEVQAAPNVADEMQRTFGREALKRGRRRK